MGWLESSACAKSTRAYDILGNGAGGVVVDAAADALDHGDHHPGFFTGTQPGTAVAGQDSVAGAIEPIVPVGIRHPRRGWRRERGSRQLVGPRDGNLCIGFRRAVAEGRDLKPTTDLRAVLKGLLRDHLRVDERVLASTVFPDSADVVPTAGLVG